MAGYEHVGSLRHFTVKGKMWAEPSFRWVEWDRLMGRIRRIAADGVKDHNIGDYVSLISNQMALLTQMGRRVPLLQGGSRRFDAYRGYS